MKRKVVLVVAGLAVCLLAIALTVQPKGQAWQRPLIPTPENDGSFPPEDYPRMVKHGHGAILVFYNEIYKPRADRERTNRGPVVTRYVRNRDMKNAYRVLRGEPSTSLVATQNEITRLCTKWGSPPEWFTNGVAPVAVNLNLIPVRTKGAPPSPRVPQMPTFSE